MKQCCALLAAALLLCAAAGDAQVLKTEQPKAAAPNAVRKEAVKRRTVILPAPAGRPVPANPAAQQRQFVQQLRPLLRVEYYFVKRVCDLTPEQRREIARAGELALRETARSPNLFGLRAVHGPQTPADFPDPVKAIRESLAAAVKKHLTPEQAERYREETKRRDEHWRQLALRSLVAFMDQELLLTEEQRAAIGKSLADGWDGRWAPSLSSLENLQNFFPPIPESYVVPHLSVAQKAVWNSSQPRRRGVIFGLNMVAVDNGVEDEELTEAREAADKAQGEGK